MKTGTKTIIYGGHQFILHPLFVFVAWWRLYGRPSWRESVCIAIHDWGLWGMSVIDSGEGENHPEGGARIAQRLFGLNYSNLVRYHSRFYARKCGEAVSRLCLADKWGTAMYPTWLWILLVKLSGEHKEYANNRKYEIYKQRPQSLRTWFDDYKQICQRWVETGDLTIGKGNMV